MPVLCLVCILRIIQDREALNNCAGQICCRSHDCLLGDVSEGAHRHEIFCNVKMSVLHTQAMTCNQPVMYERNFLLDGGAKR